jgi:hypothetical protein
MSDGILLAEGAIPQIVLCAHTFIYTYIHA